MSARRLILGDAFEELPRLALDEELRFSVVTSLPDPEELPSLSLERWREWFREAARLCLSWADPEGAAVFYQTDRRRDGALESKARLLLEAAEAFDEPPLLRWHRIVLRRAPGSRDLYRPTFGHLLGFSWLKRSGPAGPDVLPKSPALWKNGVPLAAAAEACRMAAGPGLAIVDPFCGRGTIPSVAEALGLEAIGIEIEEQEFRAAEALELRRHELELVKEEA